MGGGGGGCWAEAIGVVRSRRSVVMGRVVATRRSMSASRHTPAHCTSPSEPFVKSSSKFGWEIRLGAMSIEVWVVRRRWRQPKRAVRVVCHTVSLKMSLIRMEAIPY